MKNEKIKLKFKELVEKAKEIENQCREKIIDFIETPFTEEVIIDGKHYQLLKN